jgi:hypothetical protein
VEEAEAGLPVLAQVQEQPQQAQIRVQEQVPAPRLSTALHQVKEQADSLEPVLPQVGWMRCHLLAQPASNSCSRRQTARRTR